MLTLAIAIGLSCIYHPYSWRNVEIVGGGFVTGVVAHPKAKDLVYARTDIGGAYRWDPQANRWVPLQDWVTRPDWTLYGIESLAVDPSDPDRLYLAAGMYTNEWSGNGAILRSSDRGESWKRTDLPFKNGGNEPGRSMGERLAVDPHDGKTIFFGSRRNGLWRSRDHAVRWSKVESFPVKGDTAGVGVAWVVFADKPARAVYACVAQPGTPVYRSLDSGETWHPLDGQPSSGIPHHLAVAADGTLYFSYSNGPGPNDVTDGAVWKMDVDGRWADITPLKPDAKQKFGYAGLAVDPQNPGVVMAATLDRWGKDTVFRSVDRGKTWVSLADAAQMDAGVAPFMLWARPKAEFGHWIGCVTIDPFDSNRAWYVTGATVWGTSDLTQADSGRPTHWKIRAEGLEETAVVALVSPPIGAQVVSGLGDIGGFRHEDLTKSPPGGMWTNPLQTTVEGLDFAEMKPEIFVRVGTGGGLLNGAVSDDGAKTWTPLASNPPGRRGGGSVAVSADGKRIVWGSFVTADRGATWVRCGGVPPDGRPVADRVDPDSFYFQAGSSLYVSRDGAQTFTLCPQALPAKPGPVAAVFGRKGHLWLPAGDGLYCSTDAGGSFRKTKGVESAEQVGFGKAEAGRDYPAIYLIGVAGGVEGIYRSVDEGDLWERINGARSGFGTMQRITGDPKLFGRVYVGTNGRGILVGDPK